MSFKRALLATLFCASLICLSAGYALFQRFEGDQAALASSLQASSLAEVKRSAESLEHWLQGLKLVVDGIASDVNSGALPPHAFRRRLLEELERTPQALGIGIVFFPLATDPDFRRKTPFYVSRTDPYASGTTGILAESGQIMSVLQSDSGSGTSLLTGLVIMDFPRRALKEEMRKVRLGQFGYPSLISQNGVFIWHPREEFIVQGKSLFDLAIERNLPSLMEFAKSAVRGQTVCREIIGPLSGRPAWALSAPIPSVKWSLIAKIDTEGQLRPSPGARRYLFIALLVTVTGLIGLVLTFALSPTVPSFRRLWVTAFTISAILFGGIATVWWLALEYGEEPIEGSIPLTEPSVLARYQDEFVTTSKRLGWPKPLFVPTGLYIQSIAFDGALSVKVNGYAWQVFTPETASLTEGLTFPEATDDVTMEKAFDRQEGDRRVVGWRFNAELRQWFDYRRYPFDLQSVWLQLWPQDFNRNIILIPDLSSYEIINPESKPGVRSDIVLPGWDIMKSYFSFIPKEYNTTFGFSEFQGSRYFPELFFHIIIKRRFLDPFLSNLLPLLVVAFLNFTAILIATRREKLIGLFGFSAGTSMGIAGGLVFVVILAQNDLRQRLEVAHLMYLDYYYFVMYFLLIAVAVDAVVFTWSRRIWFLHHRDHLLPKLIYWPLTMSLLFSVTIWSFFP